MENNLPYGKEKCCIFPILKTSHKTFVDRVYIYRIADLDAPIVVCLVLEKMLFLFKSVIRVDPVRLLYLLSIRLRKPGQGFTRTSLSLWMGMFKT